MADSISIQASIDTRHWCEAPCDDFTKLLASCHEAIDLASRLSSLAAKSAQLARRDSDTEHLSCPTPTTVHNIFSGVQPDK
jgi:hypothetical protein